MKKKFLAPLLLAFVVMFFTNLTEGAPADNWETWFQSGNQSMNFGDFSAAIKNYSQSILLLPAKQSGKEVFASRAVALCMNRNYSESLIDAEESLRRSAVPYAFGLYAKGCALRGLKKTDDAIDNLNKAVQADSRLGWAYWMRSKIFVEQQNFKAADADANRLINMYPASFLGYDVKGYEFYKQKQWMNAIQWYRKALERFPMSRYSYWRIAKSYTHLGDMPNAVKAYKEFWRFSGLEDPNAWKAKEIIDEYERRQQSESL